MRQTRSSTRLANVAKKAPPANKQVPAAPDSDFGDYPSGWMGQATDDMLEETHTDDVDFEDEEEEVVVPKRKRQRTSQGAKPPARKRQVRGKQGRLEGLMKMPIDIFTEIALYLMPGDIIVLSRANKFFRSLLMHRSAIHIWHGVMRSVPGLPPCPPDMSEPRYLALIYSRHCSNCGATVTRRMDETLRVRLCPSCRDQSLVNYRDIPTEIQSLVLYSSKIVPNKRRYGYEIHCLVSDVTDVTAKLEELKVSDSPVALERWKDDRQKLLETRRKEAADLGVFLNSIDITRDQELSDLRRQRRSDIEQRLMALGWEQNDMVLHYAMSREWTSLVDQPKPLTDRTWENLRPKLIPILEANRAARLAHEKTQRKQARRTKLDAHLSEVRAGRAPLLDVTIRTPPIPSPNAEPSTMKVVHKGIFPDLVDALEWPIMKDLLETDVPVAELDARLDEHREDIERQIDAWILDVQTRCAEVLRTGREDDGLDRHAPDPTLSLEGDSAADPLAHLSSDLKLLLRADSLFEPIKTGSSTSHVYDALVLNGYRQVHDPLRPLRYSKGPLELTRVKRHQGAQAAARVLLEHLGKPDASYLEMRSGGQNYVCGRCPDNSAKSWEEIVHHYMQNRAVWDFSQKPENQLKLTELGITFNNVHDPAFDTDKPMLKIVTPIEATLAVSNMLHGGQTKVCRVCQKVGFLSEVRGREDSIIAHLLDVHGIAEPKVPEHYGSAFYGAIFTDMFDYDGSDPYGLYDSDPFDEDPWGMYGYSDDEAFLW